MMGLYLVFQPDQLSPRRLLSVGGHRVEVYGPIYALHGADPGRNRQCQAGNFRIWVIAGHIFNGNRWRNSDNGDTAPCREQLAQLVTSA